MDAPHNQAEKEKDETEQKQCKICLDGEDPELGRLIHPCLCKGTISYVHVKCLHLWRNSSDSAFYACRVCHYRYNFARTRVAGMATNPLAIGALSSVFFTLIVLASSFLSTAILSALDDSDLDPGYYYFSTYSSNPFSWYNPFTVGRDLVRAALRIIQDESAGLLDPDSLLSRVASPSPSAASNEHANPPGLLVRLLRRFALGLPVVGAGSIVHMLLSVPLLGPIQWIARFRGRRNRRDSSSTDAAALIVIVLLVIGALRAIYKVYQLTESLAKRLLLRAEDVILEVVV
ncbi:hypothetical protein OF83DRAFT_1165569 [Amylostereum chailletii]|nr:hypothetical protein OF83DRAFT_1165569 [Amylostereum chailletii]